MSAHSNIPCIRPFTAITRVRIPPGTPTVSPICAEKVLLGTSEGVSCSGTKTNPVFRQEGYSSMKCFCRLFIILVAVWPLAAAAQRSIPDDNLAYPVSISLSDCNSNIASSQGSGFFFLRGVDLYLVTARHVLFNMAERVQPGQPRPFVCNKALAVAYSRNPKERQHTRMQLDLPALRADGSIKAHETHDVVVVRIGKSAASAELKSGEEATFYYSPGITVIEHAQLLTTTTTSSKKLDEVLTANDVYVLGYPSSIGLHYNTPLVRKGIVAGINYTNKTIVLDCLIFHGNSGGPVLQVTHLPNGVVSITTIGLIVQYVPVAETWVNATQNYSNMQIYNSGYSIAEPMDFVFELTAK